MSNKEAKCKLKVLYGCRCLLTNIRTSNLEYHHIFKKEWGGQATIKNGANLIHDIHSWLHSLENEDIELFWLVNECLDLYKQCLDQGLIELIKEYENECIPEFKKKMLISQKRSRKK